HRDPERGLVGGESNYTGQNTVAQATPGVWLLPSVNLSYRMRIRRFAVEEGQVSGLPFIGDRYRPASTRGLFKPALHWAHQVALTYDSRDSFDIPTHGALALAYVEMADRRLGSSTSFVKFGAEWRDFIPLRQGNPILALHALANYTSGDLKTPFWEQSSLGGRRTLRGFGSDRFIDFNRSLGAAELRTRVWQRKLFGVNAELELAPFAAAGRREAGDHVPAARRGSRRAGGGGGPWRRASGATRPPRGGGARRRPRGAAARGGARAARRSGERDRAGRRHRAERPPARPDR